MINLIPEDLFFSNICHFFDKHEFSSDFWVSCKDNKLASYKGECYKNGTFTINGKSGNGIEMPNCDPIGCNPADLHIFNTKTPFFRSDPLLYQKFETILIFWSGKLYLLCSPGNREYQKSIHF